MHLRMIYSRLLTADGASVTVGGIQTYLQSLAEVAAGMGMRPVLYQCAIKPFRAQLGVLQVVGVNTGDVSISASARHQLHDAAVADRGNSPDIILFGTEGVAVPTDDPRALLIQHGISWDRPVEQKPRSHFWERRFPFVKALRLARFHLIFVESFERCHNRVCVDYNFQNWYRTFQPEADGKRTWVIPNFTPIPSAEGLLRRRQSDGGVSILFARRFETYRGTRLMAAVAHRLLQEFRNVRFTFAGEGPDREWMQRQFANEPRVTLTVASYENRMQLTLDHDIAVVPTLGSEGTSLSLAEAMACGCAVVATDVGGMTQMVFDGYNGLMVAPQEATLYQGLRRLVVDAELRHRLGNRAREVAAASFSLEKWQSSWRCVLEQVASARECLPPAEPQECLEVAGQSRC